MAKARGEKSGRSLVWLQGLACGALAALLPAVAAQLVVLLLPAILALWMDPNAGKPIGRTVLLYGLACSVEPMRGLWAGGQFLDASPWIMPEFRAIALAWSAAATGWLLTQIIPLAINTVLDAAAERRLTQLRDQREQLVREWGLDEVTEDQ